MNELDERIFAQKIRQTLNHGSAELGPEVTERLFAARREALAHQPARVGVLAFAGVDLFSGESLLHRARTTAAIFALVLGAAGTYYWNNFQQADDNEEVDSALLADELPINAYLDPGFHAWLERSAPSSPQE